jgi:hypothetical protein
MKTYTIIRNHKTRRNLKIKTMVFPKREMEDSTKNDILDQFQHVKAAKKEGNLIRKLIGNETATCAIFHTRSDGNILPISSRNKENTGAWYKNGYFLDRVGKGRWNFTSYTIENDQHVLNFHFIVDDNGLMLEDGVVNYFVGMHKALKGDADTQDYIYMHIDELLEKQKDGKKFWDEVK